MNKIGLWLSEDGLLRISAWRRDGLTRKNIADKIGISENTLSKWISSYPDIANAMQNKRDKIDIMVENAILRKALGFSTTEVRTVTKPNGAEETTMVQKEVPPDLSAASVWLKNRRPDKWRDKPSEDKSNILSNVDNFLESIDAQADR